MSFEFTHYHPIHLCQRTSRHNSVSIATEIVLMSVKLNLGHYVTFEG